MPLLDKLTSAFGGNIMDGASKVIDAFEAPKEAKEKAQIDLQTLIDTHIEKLTEDANKELEIQLADTANARDSNAKIQESEHASWLSKNVAYCLDILLGLVWSSCTVYILARALKLVDEKADMTIILSIHGTITAVFMTIVNFHRGTSKGSEDKSKQLHDIAMK